MDLSQFLRVADEGAIARLLAFQKPGARAMATTRSSSSIITRGRSGRWPPSNHDQRPAESQRLLCLLGNEAHHAVDDLLLEAVGQPPERVNRDQAHLANCLMGPEWPKKETAAAGLSAGAELNRAASTDLQGTGKRVYSSSGGVL